jgi:thiol-disulfide isomerase/thioredoxin
MNINLSEIKKKTKTVNQYILSLEQPFRQEFLTRKQTYRLQPEAVNRLRKSAGKYTVIAFSATWCKDCATCLPVLALIAEATGLQVRVFGGLKKDPLSHVHKWRIPPSPAEVEIFHVDRIPLILIFDVDGKEIGRIVETPKKLSNLEEELCEIIGSKS